MLARALHGSSSAAIGVSGMSILAKSVPQNLRTKIMPLAFGGIALGVLIGYPLGGAAYQLLGKPAPFILIAFLISISISKCVGVDFKMLQSHFSPPVLLHRPRQRRHHRRRNQMQPLLDPLERQTTVD